MIPYRKLTDQYNVVYQSMGKSDRSAMPLGNGRLGLSLWVEQDGNLQFYIGHTDAYSEMDRNLKLGKVFLHLSPNPFTADCIFSQELRLRDGCIQISAKTAENQVGIKIFVDAETDSIYLDLSSQQPITASARLVSWRTAERAPWDIPDLENGGQIVESPDRVECRQNGILFYHKNHHSCLRTVAMLEGLGACLDQIPDTLGDRTFGGYLTLKGGYWQENRDQLISRPKKHHSLRISAFCQQTPDTENIIQAVITRHRSMAQATTAARRTALYWDRYFGQSYIFVSGDREVQAPVSDDLAALCLEPADELPVPSKVTQSYLLTRFMFACSGLGEMPIQFNGLIFNLMPGLNRHLSFDQFCHIFAAQPAGEPSLEINPDEKGWESAGTLWQNVRLPYASMLARGETEPVRKLFAYYRKFWEINRAKAQIYYQAEGQYNTEITTSFGLMPSGVYGTNREGLPDGYAANRWGGAVDISPGLELCTLMLDYYHFTGDSEFLQQELLPYAQDLLHFVETRFREREKGRIVLQKLQAVETYWDTTDPITVVAGMHAVIDRILALDPGLVANRAFFEHMKCISPGLPLEQASSGNAVLAPARCYEPERHNVENPALYAVFPFRLFGLDKPDLQRMQDTFWHCMKVSGCYQPQLLGTPPGAPGYSGWQYIGMTAALLGMADEAAEILINNCALKNPGTRFPAMWGPVYDAVPDVDHGSNILTTLQLMAFQTDGQKTRVLPAWPKNWDVVFKLHANTKTTVECVYRGGKIEKLSVQPQGNHLEVVQSSI